MNVLQQSLDFRNLSLVLENPTRQNTSILDKILEEPQTNFAFRKGSILESYEITLGKHKHTSGLKPKEGKDLPREIKKRPKHLAKLKAKKAKAKARRNCLQHQKRLQLWLQAVKKMRREEKGVGIGGGGTSEARVKILQIPKPEPLPICPECGLRHK